MAQLPIQTNRGHDVPKYKTETHRFLAKVLVGDECWQWTGSGTLNGYGQFAVRGRKIYAHRYMYDLLVAPIPSGMQLDHLCRVRRCVRPDHLEPVTARENQLRGNGVGGRNAAKTHCVNGHPFDAQNTYHRPDGYRDCYTCKRARKQRFDELRRYRQLGGGG